MAIAKLDSNVISKIRSSFSINSVSQCVLELVYNSLDAKSTSVAVRLNLLTFKIQIADNGEGITKENMGLLGLRYTTNKCRKLTDLEKNLKTYGFRGEAIASIVEMCKSVSISSRHKTSSETYHKLLSKGFKAKLKPTKHRASVGTTVTILGWFSSVPVRQQMIVQEVQLEEVKKALENLIMINPGVSFTLRNDVTGLLLLSSPKCLDIVDSFRHLHPEVTDAFTLFKVSKSKVSVQMLMQREFVSNKHLQYIYVNKRPVRSSKIRRHIFKAFCKKDLQKTKNPLLASTRYPVYVMNIKCPQACVNNVPELEFTCWKLVLACTDKIIKTFLGAEDKGDRPKPVQGKIAETFNCGVSQLFGAVQAAAFKRKSDQGDNNVSKVRREEVKQPFVKNKTVITPSQGTSANYEIEDSNKHAKPKRMKSVVKKPLEVLVKKPTDAQFDQRSVYSRFDTKEDRGKDLIMEMFLKSTQVFKDSPDVSKETIEESNFLFGNNIQDTARGVNTTMSISVNVKREKLKNLGFKTLPEENPGLIRRRGLRAASRCQPPYKRPILTSKSVQTSQNPVWAKQKSYQTDLAARLDGFTLGPDNREDVRDDYTILINTVREKREYVFVRKNDEEIDNTEYRPLKICRCRREDENMFQFGKEPSVALTLFEDKPVEYNFKKPPIHVPKPKTICRNENQSRRLLNGFRGISKHPGPKRHANKPRCTQSPYFIPSAYEKFQPMFKSTRNLNNDNMVSPSLTKNYPDLGLMPNNNFHQPVGFPDLKKNCKTCCDQNEAVHRLKMEQMCNFKNCCQMGFCGHGEKSEYSLPKVLSNHFLNEKDLGHTLVVPSRKNGNNSGEKLFNYKSSRSPNIFTDEVAGPEVIVKHNGGFQDLNTISNPGDFGSAKSSSRLEITLPNSKERKQTIEKDLLVQNNDTFIDLEENRMEEIEAQPSEKSIIIMDSQNEWVKKLNEEGSRFFINKRTGMVTAKTPNLTQVRFDFDERLDFVPKGMSPVLKEHKKVDPTLSQGAKSKLHDLILEGYDDELMLVKWQHFLGDDPKRFFEEIYKEKTKQFETFIPTIHKDISKLPASLVSFTSQLFGNIEFIGQVDKKFIAVRETSQNLLILFDQHAVHERIRVEQLLTEYKGFKTPCKEKLTIFLQHVDLCLFKKHSSYVESLGVGFECFNHGIHLTDMPVCLKEKLQEVNNEDMTKILNILIKDIVGLLKTTGGAAVKLLPKIIQNIINLKACRGAVKFGDALTTLECLNLLNSLSKCHLPFQCAHGRPTLTPLVTLSKVRLEAKKKIIDLKRLLPS